jgi:hypothetical protein
MMLLSLPYLRKAIGTCLGTAHIDLVLERWNPGRIHLHESVGKNLFFDLDNLHTGEGVGLQGQF